MANSVGRPRGLPKSPNSGRKKGTANSKPATPEAVREEVRGHILESYTAMGGVEWLKQIARDHPLAFLSQCWSRIAPPVPKPEEAIGNNTTVNIGSISNFEAARYIAFALAQATHAQDSPPVKTIEYQPEPAKPLPPYEPPTATPEPAVDIEKLKAEDLIRNTHEKTIETYAGSSREQGIKRRRNLI